MHCILGCSALQPGFQCTASALAVHCVQNNLRRTYLQGQMLNEGFSRKRLRERLQTFAGAVANVCGGGCKRLRGRLQCFASERGKTGDEIVSPILDERKDGSIRVTIAPRKILLSAEESVSHVVMSFGALLKSLYYWSDIGRSLEQIFLFSVLRVYKMKIKLYICLDF